MHGRYDLAVYVIKLHKIQTILRVGLINALRHINLRRYVRVWCGKRIDLLHGYTIGGICGGSGSSIGGGGIIGCGFNGGISNGVISGITGR
jgi:hypothetical protein